MGIALLSASQWQVGLKVGPRKDQMSGQVRKSWTSGRPNEWAVLRVLHVYR